MGKIKKSQGVTQAERYLNRLAQRSFLSLWSYPGVYRDQGRAGKQRQGKELCDLLVVFDEHILIFSDKDCQYPDTGREELDWKRWFKRAIHKPAQQIWGAERWIRDSPDRLYLDRNCTESFPLVFPPPHRAVIHRIVVAHGVSRKVSERFGGTGSLLLRSDLQGAAHYDSSLGRITPYYVGDLDPNRGFVHILDDWSLQTTMKVLDTVSDFVAYLGKKESFFRRTAVLAAGEDDLLAFYLSDMNSQDEHDFVVPEDHDRVVIPEGHWEHFSKSPQRQAQIKANEVSYVWDELIEKSAYHAMNDSQHFSTDGGLSDTELILRFMAREGRTRRRLLAESLFEIIGKTSSTQRGTRIVQPSRSGDPYYVFLLLPESPSPSYEEYREVRRNMLQACCLVLKLRFPDARDIVGFATETEPSDSRSEDYLYFDAREWDEDLQREAQRLQNELELLTDLNPLERRSVLEYAEVGPSRNPSPRASRKTGRNEPCPCGSGRKYKKCHGDPRKRR